MKRIFNITFLLAALAIFLGSCVKNLDTTPIDPNSITPANVYTSVAGYKQVLAKCYAGLSVSGQWGPAGRPDISGIDEGFGEYLRGYWYTQELTTDEAVIGWNDQTLKDFHYQAWGPGDVFIQAMYYRIFYQICLTNEFIREASDANLDSRGITGQDKVNVQMFRAEARFLRALSYYHALDLFGNVPFVTENDQPGKFFPPQKNRADLFKYVESELLAIEPLVADAKANEYGRADRGAVWTLLAKLYLNAGVYTGTTKYTECVTYCNKVLDVNAYSLQPKYSDLFLADNHNSNEIIFPIEFDGVNTRTWGGTTFIIHAAIGGSMNPADFGVGGGWGGTRTTKPIVNLFYPNLSKSISLYPNNTKSTTVYPVLYCPGSYQGWDPATAATIASTGSDSKYEGYISFTDASTEFKFTAKQNWDVNWGDAGNGTLAHGAANIKVTEPGYYYIKADTTALTFSVLKTTWGVIGDATAGGWSNDTPMSYDAASKTWKVTLDLVPGGLKFRANGGWDLNYGDNGQKAGLLKQGGDNINITQAGNYVVTMKLGSPDYTYSIVMNSYDHRALFYADGQSLDINDIGVFTDGYAVTKFKNVTSTGTPGLDPTFCDTDFPLFRLADVYLMYAEAVLRGGGGGSADRALALVNALRQRAYGDSGGNITATELTVDFILDERGRELLWECTRRTDLIRYNKFSTSTYVWPWKGGVKAGISTPSYLNLFPIPSSDLSANPNLTQNTGY